MTNPTELAGPTGVIVEKIVDQQMLDAAYSVRFDVFVEEQKVPVEEELDALDTDPTTIHVLALDGTWPQEQALGTARLLPTPGHPGHFHIGRVAVRESARGRKVGAALMLALEQIARDVTAAGEVVIELSAQIQATPFYLKLGYEPVSGEQYLDAGIPHQDMIKTIA